MSRDSRAAPQTTPTADSQADNAPAVCAAATGANPSSMAPTRIVGARTILAYLTGTVAILALIGADLRPAPIYHTKDWRADDSYVYVTSSQPLRFECDTPGRFPIAIWIPLTFRKDAQSLTLHISDAADGRELARRALRRRDYEVVRFRAPDRPVSRMRMEFSSEVPNEDRAPGLLWTRHPPPADATVIHGGRVIKDIGPVMIFFYSWPTRWLLVLWPMSAFAFAAAWKNERRTPSFLIAAALAATAASALLWQQDYTLHAAHRDADDYARMAQVYADYVVKPESRAGNANWIDHWAGTHNSLACVLMAGPIILGVPAWAAYLQLNALCGFGCLALLYDALRRGVGVSARAALLATAAGATHLIMIRSFARAVTDVFGLFFLMLMLWALLTRMRVLSRASHILHALLFFALPLARPQCVGYLPALVVGAGCADVVRERRVGWNTALRLALTFVPPALLLLTMYWAFDWRENVATMLRAKARFVGASTPYQFGFAILNALQGLPLFWLFGLRRWREPRIAVFVVWIVYYLALMIVARSPFWGRHFLPLWPATFALVAVGLDSLRGVPLRLGAVFVLLFCVTNVAAVVYQVMQYRVLPDTLRMLINSS
ncbi:MAG: hypothetical protein HUU22_05495 [Phycisphaerae bacterium]|nr:hypothetical protein [Phycisphaerae bacterium]NUQ45468.1 hypothetical protein [Phycisphaerae bacterium]